MGQVKSQIEAGMAQSVDRSRERAESIVRGQLGQDAQLHQAGENTRHTGEVLGVTGYHVAQSVSADSAVVHSTQKLARRPVAGRVATIQYQDGKGKVTDRSKEKAKQKEVER